MSNANGHFAVILKTLDTCYEATDKLLIHALNHLRGFQFRYCNYIIHCKISKWCVN